MKKKGLIVVFALLIIVGVGLGLFFGLRDKDKAQSGVTLTAGGSGISYADGNQSEALFAYPHGLAEKDGELFIFDSGNNRIRKIANGTVSTEAGTEIGRDGMNMAVSGYEDAAALDALLNTPKYGCWYNGNLVFSDSSNNVVRVLDKDGSVYTVISGDSISGYPEDAAPFSPSGVCLDNNGGLYVADTANHTIIHIDSELKATLYAGSCGKIGFADGPAASALFFEPTGLAIASDGTLYVADSANNLIRKISGGTVSTVCGAAEAADETIGRPQGGDVDGTAEQARLRYPMGMSFAPDGTLFFADSKNHKIKAILTNGNVVTVAGGTSGYADSEDCSKALFNEPTDVCCIDSVIYVADCKNNAIRQIKINSSELSGAEIKAPSSEQTVTARQAIIHSVDNYDGGKVTVQRGAQTLDAYNGMRLAAGDGICTDNTSTVYLLIDDDKTVRLNTNTSLTISTAGSKKLRLTLNTGEMYFDVANPLAEDEACEFSVGGTTMSIRGTHGTISTLDNKMQLLLASGNMVLIFPDKHTDTQTEIVKSNNPLSIEAGQILNVNVFTLEELPGDSATNIVPGFPSAQEFLNQTVPVTPDSTPDTATNRLPESARFNTDSEELANSLGINRQWVPSNSTDNTSASATEANNTTATTSATTTTTTTVRTTNPSTTSAPVSTTTLPTTANTTDTTEGSHILACGIHSGTTTDVNDIHNKRLSCGHYGCEAGDHTMADCGHYRCSEGFDATEHEVLACGTHFECSDTTGNHGLLDCGHYGCEDGDHTMADCGHWKCAENYDATEHEVLACGTHFECSDTTGNHIPLKCGHFACEPGDHSTAICGHYRCSEGFDATEHEVLACGTHFECSDTTGNHALLNCGHYGCEAGDHSIADCGHWKCAENFDATEHEVLACGTHFECSGTTGNHALLNCGHYGCEAGDHTMADCGHWKCAENFDATEHEVLACGTHFECSGTTGNHEPLDCGHYGCEAGDHSIADCGHWKCAENFDATEHEVLACGTHFECSDTTGNHTPLKCGHFACEPGDHTAARCGHFRCSEGFDATEHEVLACGTHFECSDTTGNHEPLDCGHYGCEAGDHSLADCGHWKCAEGFSEAEHALSECNIHYNCLKDGRSHTIFEGCGHRGCDYNYGALPCGTHCACSLDGESAFDHTALPCGTYPCMEEDDSPHYLMQCGAHCACQMVEGEEMAHNVTLDCGHFPCTVNAGEEALHSTASTYCPNHTACNDAKYPMLPCGDHCTCLLELDPSEYMTDHTLTFPCGAYICDTSVEHSPLKCGEHCACSVPEDQLSIHNLMSECGHPQCVIAEGDTSHTTVSTICPNHFSCMDSKYEILPCGECTCSCEYPLSAHKETYPCGAYICEDFGLEIPVHGFAECGKHCVCQIPEGEEAAHNILLPCGHFTCESTDENDEHHALLDCGHCECQLADCGMHCVACYNEDNREDTANPYLPCECGILGHCDCMCMNEDHHKLDCGHYACDIWLGHDEETCPGEPATI